MTKVIHDTLARNAVFSVLSQPRRKALVEGAAQLHLNKDGRLFGHGDEANVVYAIVSGEIEVTIKGPDGRDVFIARLGAGTIVGEMGVLDGVPRSTDVHATRKTELWKIGRQAILDALQAEPTAAMALLSVLASRIRETDALVDRNASMNLGKRLARLLLEESAHGKIIYNQSDLAHLIGATREAVNRKIAEWRKASYIDLNKTGLHVLDRHALIMICKRKAAI